MDTRDAITPEEAHELYDGYMNSEFTASVKIQASSADIAQYARLLEAAPNLAKQVAGLTEEWGVQIGDQGLACMVFLNGTTDIWGTEKHARAEYAVQASRFDGAARMVRRYVSAGAVAE